MLTPNEIQAMKERDKEAILRGELHPDAPITLDRHKLLLDREELQAEVERLLKCCDFTADGKPVVRGSTLFLYPNGDTTREIMTLKVKEADHYCWYQSQEDAIAQERKGEK